MNKQWKQLKDTIVEIRDNNELEHEDVTLMCRFLVNYMEVLEKQMQEPCADTISRQSAILLANDLKQDLPDDERIADMVMAHNEGILEYQTQLSLLPPVNPQPKTGYWIRTGNYLTTAYSSIEYVKCSCCHEDSLEEGDYCPNCGAIMSEIPTGSESEEV